MKLLCISKNSFFQRKTNIFTNFAHILNLTRIVPVIGWIFLNVMEYLEYLLRMTLSSSHGYYHDFLLQVK